MRKALIVGINSYESCPLSGCINDATALASILEKNGDGSPNFNTKLENDIKTKSELKKLISELFAGSNDASLFYFSGHGFINEVGGYIVTPDYKSYDEGVSMDEILKIANDSKAKNKIIILDCCHSGAFGSPAISSNNTSQIVEGMTILTASRSTESAVEVNGHGIFTNLLLDALQGGASDLVGNITPGSIYSYIDQALGAWEQRPVFKTNITNFISLRKISTRVPIENIRELTKYFTSPEMEFKLDPSFEYTIPNHNGDNVEIFKKLQKLQSIGLVVPSDGEEHMYYAAINSKSCKLTSLGYHYWRLVKNNKI